MPEQTPFAVTQIDHVVIRAADIERMKAFYGDVLGLALERELVEIGLHQYRAGAALIDLVDCSKPLGTADGPPPGDAPNMAHFCLIVDPFDPAAIAAWLEPHGITFDPPAERYGAGGHGLSVYIADPEGNVIELKAPAGVQGEES